MCRTSITTTAIACLLLTAAHDARGQSAETVTEIMTAPPAIAEKMQQMMQAR
ncbi:MAG: hypothetical protein K2Y71_17105 [Xanthobacteraceae bacterium]|nr:hypothetical protein [Xanthobacteraceae bacterium]